MERIIGDLKGKRIDVNCGSGSAFRGENVEVSDGVLTLRDEHDKVFYIDLTKIVAVSEVADSVSKPGFIV